MVHLRCFKITCGKHISMNSCNIQDSRKSSKTPPPNKISRSVPGHRSNCLDWQVLLHCIDRWSQQALHASQHLECRPPESTEMINWLLLEPSSLSLSSQIPSEELSPDDSDERQFLMRSVMWISPFPEQEYITISNGKRRRWYLHKFSAV